MADTDPEFARPVNEEVRLGPTPVFPELSVDLDLRTLTAAAETERWETIIAGSHAVLDRLDDLASPDCGLYTDDTVIADLRACSRQLYRGGARALGHWLDDVKYQLMGQRETRQMCARRMRGATDYVDATWAITGAVRGIDCATRNIGNFVFAGIPLRQGDQPAYQITEIAGRALVAESRRPSLRQQLDGAGGLAGTELYNPFVAAMTAQQIVMHRRVYRQLYDFASLCGFPAGGFVHPDTVDAEEL